MKKKDFVRLFVFLCIVVNTLNAQLVHPGISHKLSDLDRMKHMVDAEIDPWFTTYNNMKSAGYSSYDYTLKGSSSNTTITSLSDFENDGNAAYHNALMWYITGDERHAQKSVEIFNAWSNITRIENQFALSNGGALWRMVEGAEIIKHTYSGWSSSNQQAFADMLVYPGWSGTTEPTAAMASKDVSFYWNIYQGDRARHGNQGLFGYRSLMAMGIFLDNEIIYDRALRYLQGYSHRIDDLPYPSGPPVTQLATTGNEYYEEYTITSWNSTIPDYRYNEVMSNYIYENGQCQESSRDQAHALGGVSIITCISEIAWNQGDNLYGHLNNRPLLGMEFYLRYNLSYEHSYPDQLTPWEPTVASGEFIERTDRSGRWKSLKMNPWTAANLTQWNRGLHNLNPIYEMNLGHYRDRLKTLPSDDYKWLERGFDVMTAALGVEDGANVGNHPGWGGLKFRRVSPGDPISGFDGNGLPEYKINELPMTLEAENYDYFVLDGQDRTYNDTSASNEGNEYRTDEDVDIEVCSSGGYNVNEMQSGEYLTYTVHVPADANYNIEVNYSGINGNGTLNILFNGVDKTGAVALPSTGGAQSWADLTLASDVNLTRGVQSMKIIVGGSDNSFNLNSISVVLAEKIAQTIDFYPLPIRETNDENVALVASVSSSLDLVFSSSDPGVASISNGELEINGAGLTTITVTQAGNDIFESASTSQVFQVNDINSGLLVQAEDFSTNSGLRSETTTDVGGGQNMGHTTAGNYLIFNVNVPESGTYVVDYRISSNSDGGSLSLLVGGNIVDNLDFSATGGWQTWETVTSYSEIELTQGLNSVRLNVNAPGWNINWFKFHLKDNSLSTQDVSDVNQIKIYPNPTKDNFTITNSLNSNIEIYDMLGKVLLKTKVKSNNQDIDMSHLNRGIYIIQIDNNGSRTSKKIVKN